ncbi:MAG TPA: HupE/UreJ family protein [Polyangiaceae bacterium]|nr:HupE/UreJ family protein [Polyangiaceae bacterium]
MKLGTTRSRARATRWPLALALATTLLALGTPASAHAIGLSRGEYVQSGSGVAAQLTFSRADSDAVDDGELLRGVVVRADGEPCEAHIEGRETANPDGVVRRMRFACPRPIRSLALTFGVFDDLPDGHRHAARLRVDGGAGAEDVLYRRHETVSLRLDAPASLPLAMLAFVRMGIEHILTGYDHLAFLFALVVVGGRKRSLLGVVTAFTAAHSITLAVAALGLWSPPARVVEPAIALSIAYVGVENFFVRNGEGRWRLTFPFGLVHGFGFASALRDVGLPTGERVGALVSFNLGVEAGQLLVLAAVLPLLAWARPSRAQVFALSGATALVGAVWFVARIATSPARF